MKNIVILENVRSAYNVGNIIRTADALWWDVWIVWYTPYPDEQPKVIKTSLWAEKNVWLKRFDYTIDAIAYARGLGIKIFACEICENAKVLDKNLLIDWNNIKSNCALIFWNEIDWVLEKTLQDVDNVVFVPMKWLKESMNVGQTAAIFMWELRI